MHVCKQGGCSVIIVRRTTASLAARHRTRTMNASPTAHGLDGIRMLSGNIDSDTLTRVKSNLVKVALVDSELQSMVRGGAFAFNCGKRDLVDYVQPASLDIPIGKRCLLLRDKVLPFRKRVASLLKEEAMVLAEETVEEGGSFLLLKGQTYLFPCGQVELGSRQYGSLSPKSSIGRVDLMVRGIFDYCGLYDTIRGKGELWMEVTPRSFNVRVAEGQALSQLMVFETRDEDAEVKRRQPLPEALTSVCDEAALSFDELGNQLPLHVHRGALVLSLNVAPFDKQNEDEVENENICGNCNSPTKPRKAVTASELFLPNQGADSRLLVGFEAVPTSAVLDLTRVGTHRGEDFFRSVYRNPNKMSVTLEKDKFYILSTKERISIPTNLSAEMVPFSQHVGELRAHYAGFFDPGFGYGHAGEIKGTVGVLEVRPHETITVYDGQPICLMEFFNNSAVPKKPYGFAHNNYQGQQGPKLAKFFKAL